MVYGRFGSFPFIFFFLSLLHIFLKKAIRGFHHNTWDVCLPAGFFQGEELKRENMYLNFPKHIVAT